MKKIVSTLLLLGCLYACNSDNTSPEQQIKLVLSNIEKAAENRDTSSIMKYIDEQYSDHQGQDKPALKRLMTFYLLRNQNINIFTKVNDLTIENNIATVEVSAAMASQGIDLNNESERLNADLHRFSVALKKGSDTWLIQSISWQRGW